MLQEKLLDKVHWFQDLLERSPLLECDEYCKSLHTRIEQEIDLLHRETVARLRRGGASSTAADKEANPHFEPGYN